MGNMTIENIGSMIKTGDVQSVMEGGRTVMAPQAPEPPGAGMGASPATGSFGQLLETQLEKVNQLQVDADRAAEELAAGRNKNIHETMLLMEQADMSFRLAMQVRNKILDAYREVMRMQV